MIDNRNYLYMVLTVYYEARGESRQGQKDVAKVIMNRAKSRNWPISHIVFAKKQFSCWNAGVANAPKVDVIELLAVSANCAEAVTEWDKGDTINGATHYFNPNKCSPEWAKSMTVVSVEGNHIFLKENLSKKA
jgi:spore germination cell wall hydrolase CwlJ-like protein